jgi:hypothetical protein
LAAGVLSTIGILGVVYSAPHAARATGSSGIALTQSTASGTIPHSDLLRANVELDGHPAANGTSVEFYPA